MSNLINIRYRCMPHFSEALITASILNYRGIVSDHMQDVEHLSYYDGHITLHGTTTPEKLSGLVQVIDQIFPNAVIEEFMISEYPDYSGTFYGAPTEGDEIPLDQSREYVWPSTITAVTADFLNEIRPTDYPPVTIQGHNTMSHPLFRAAEFERFIQKVAEMDSLAPRLAVEARKLLHTPAQEFSTQRIMQIVQENDGPIVTAYKLNQMEAMLEENGAEALEAATLMLSHVIAPDYRWLDFIRYVGQANTPVCRPERRKFLEALLLENRNTPLAEAGLNGLAYLNSKLSLPALNDALTDWQEMPTLLALISGTIALIETDGKDD